MPGFALTYSIKLLYDILVFFLFLSSYESEAALEVFKVSILVSSGNPSACRHLHILTIYFLFLQLT